MGELCEQILPELAVHAAIEEEDFYPAVRELGEELGPVVAEGLEEHHVAATLAPEIQAAETGEQEWIAKVTVLIESVEHHASEEETEMFPRVRSAMDDRSLEDLAAAMERRRGQLGAPRLADKEHLSTSELRELASSRDVPGRSTMNHEELAATVGIY